MSDYIKILLLAELAAGFTALFQWIRRESILHQLWHRAYDSLETAAARRVQDNRRSLQLLQGKKGFWQRMEQRLLYSGISRRFPFLTPELWILGNLAAGMAAYFLALLLGAAWQQALLAAGGLWLLVSVAVNQCMSHNYNATDENLMKFLDFLGNYSITSGEITAVLGQVSPMWGSRCEGCWTPAITRHRPQEIPISRCWPWQKRSSIPNSGNWSGTWRSVCGTLRT